MSRFPKINPEDMSYEQQGVVALISARRKPSVSSKGGVSGPFVPLVYLPGYLDRVQALGEHCRFHTSIPPKLRELAILVVARHVAAPLEFHVHAMEAREFGLNSSAIEAIANDTRPLQLDEDEAIVYDLAKQISESTRISKPTLQLAKKRFGMHGIVELITTCGYYGSLGFVINVTKASPPEFLAGFQPAFSVPND